MAKAVAKLFTNSLQIHTAEIAIRGSTRNSALQNFQALAPKIFITSEVEMKIYAEGNIRF